MKTRPLVDAAVISKNTAIDSIVERLDAARNVIRREYLRRHTDPWVVAYSGGKDSTLLLQLVWEAIATTPSKQRKRTVYVVGNDTLVESPLVIEHLRTTMAAIQAAAISAEMPIETKITKPNIDQTFWVNVIGRGYIPPTRNFRWCTDRMKILPTSRFLEAIAHSGGRTVLLVGTRKAESAHRKRNMEKHGVSPTVMNPHSSVDGCRIFAPLADLSDEDVWMTLMQRHPPWGGSHRNLITLYRNAGGGECPLVLTKEDAPSCGTTSPRFGCWTCTVVNKDKSLQGLIDSGHHDAETLTHLFDFREWLIELRENDANRERVRRNGSTKSKADGSPVMGPFTLEVRKIIRGKLEQLEREIGQILITPAEIEIIEDIWRRDEVQENCRNAFRYASDLHDKRLSA